MNTETLAIQLGYTHYVLKKNTEGLSHDQSLAIPQPGGNCMNWVVGHIMTARNGFLQLLGDDPIWTEEQTKSYQRGGEPMTDGANAQDLSSMLADLDASQERILSGLKRFDPERFGEKAPFSPSNNPDETVGSLLAGLVFHESYHAGQTGVLRRMLGLEGALR